MRIERDSMGTVEVPDDALWGAQTARAVANFPISGDGMPPAVIHALALVKSVAAQVNRSLDVLSPEKAEAITAAADAVAAGEFDDQFPVDVFQTGSGTSTNMNVNEVIAHLAQRSGVSVHPNDDVNAGQSSNDTVPTAIRVAATLGARNDLVPALAGLRDALLTKQAELADTVKAGRTHLMDAVPVTFADELGGYARQVGLAIDRVARATAATSELPLGGTAAGTGLNARPGFASAVIAGISARTGIVFTEALDHFEAQSAQDALVELHGALNVLAVSLTKICNDLRWLSSGPATGLAEIHLPDLQPGSSIMPGKVNPVVCEAVLMVCAEVVGNNTSVTWAGASGSFELNVMLPLLARKVLGSTGLLANATRLLSTRCVAGITVDRDRMRRYAEASPAIATGLNAWLGYDEVAAVVKESLAGGRTIREVVIDRGNLRDGRITEADLDHALDVDRLARGNR